MSGDSIDEHLQEIWSNWRDRNNQCQGCPHWGNGGGKAPHYGVGQITDETPTVAFVGHEGGRSGNPALEHIANRETLDLSEGQVKEIKEYIRESYPEHFENYRATDLMETGMCNGDLTDDGTPHSPYMRACYDAFRNGDNNEYGLYFTNIKKCGESYTFDETESKSKKAASRCIKYLTPELKRLAPEIIVPFGNKAAGAVFSKYEFKDGCPTNFDVEHAYDAGGIVSESLKLYETKNGIGIIPSIHFSEFYFDSWFPKVIKGRDDLQRIKSKSDYWEELVTISDKFLRDG
ncbi:uracil-DNA glycosylase family protein [Halovenus halobia]|uniref:uracil-DNA glycosylase family protein n=1 Tax=Halovenus halobia TaxID=3396622 RepID=UPI003F56D499